VNIPSPADAPWLTVIMPAHSGERWIDAALRSIATEAAEGIEVIVIDSSPTSATRDIVMSFSDRLNLRVFDRTDFKMWHDKTNFGVVIAKADYVCWLHVDDLWMPGRAASVRRWIEAAPEAVLHLAPSAIVDRDGRTLGVWRCPLPANSAIGSDILTERLLVQNFISAPAPVFRRDAWLASGGLDETLWYTADWDIWLKLATCGPVYYHDEVTTGFRIHPGSLTATGSRDVVAFADQMRIVLDKHLSRLRDRRSNIEAVARASISMNTALAAASVGDFGDLWKAVLAIVRLGPAGAHRYMRDSRIVERLTPRVRAKLRGAF
jgi:glycosyltransferase involved in cell wall biosynthesis